MGDRSFVLRGKVARNLHENINSKLIAAAELVNTSLIGRLKPHFPPPTVESRVGSGTTPSRYHRRRDSKM